MDTRAKDCARRLKVLAVGTRVQIVELLKGRTLCVGALAARLGVTQGAVSQHLRLMRDAGLVTDEKRGYYVHYRLNEKTLAAWRGTIDRLLDPAAAPGAQAKGDMSCVAPVRTRAARNRRT
jgi:DNA-binding transcriptional ArsR family regulator